MAVLELNNIGKRYKQRVIEGVSTKIHEGESIALVGPNGAGKSTLIKICLGLVKATEGEGSLMGFPLGDSRSLEQVAYVPETPGFWSELTAFDLLKFFSRIKKVSPDFHQALEEVGLKKRGVRPMGTYSKGMIQRTGIASARISQPKMMFLDEPMSGLDPRAQMRLRELLLDERSKGTTLLISSHNLDDIERLCSRILVIENHLLSEDGNVGEVVSRLRDKYQGLGSWGEEE